jgi:hypothetical protein
MGQKYLEIAKGWIDSANSVEELLKVRDNLTEAGYGDRVEPWVKQRFDELKQEGGAPSPGTNSSTSPKKTQKNATTSEPESRQPAQTTENPSAQDQTA